MRCASGPGYASRGIGLALIAGCMMAPVGAEAARASASITLEVIVKFADDSDAGRRVERALRGHPQDLSGLADLRSRLHRSTGFVLEPERVTSGRELIFRVPEEPLLESVRQTLAERTDVTLAELVAIQSENPRLAQSMLRVRFREPGDAFDLLTKAYGEQAYSERVQALTAELSAPSGVPVLGAPEADAGLAVTVDRYALLEKLVERLNAMDEVEYAQPNTTVQIMK